MNKEIGMPQPCPKETVLRIGLDDIQALPPLILTKVQWLSFNVRKKKKKQLER